MKQEFYLAVLYVNWGMWIGGLILTAINGYWSLAVTWVIGLPLAAWAYVRVLPSIRRFFDHTFVQGRVATSLTPAPTEVIIYTSLGCPFCPVVKERLITLSAAMGFRLKEVDVTLKPGILITKGIRALPVVECGTWRVEGNATSEKLANLIAGSYAGEPAVAR